MLDKSKGLVLGPELVTNGTFDTDTSGWSPVSGPASVTVSSGQVTITNAAGDGLSGISQSLTVVVGKTYIVSSELVSATELAQIRVGIAAAGLEYYAGTSNQIIFTATNTSMAVGVYCRTAGGSATWDNISVKELPGFHATQATTAARPILARVPARGRANLLERTEEFDNAVWTKGEVTITADATLSPNGATTADAMDEAAVGASHYVSQNVTLSSGMVTISAFAKQKAGSRYLQLRPFGIGTGKAFANFDLTAGEVVTGGTGGTEFVSASMVDVGDGWYQCILVGNYAVAPTGSFVGLSNGAGELPSYLGDGTSGIFIWGAQVEEGSTASAYQKVTSTYDVTEAGQADNWYLFDDLVDDAINWTAPADDYSIAFIDTGGDVTILDAEALSGATNVLQSARTGSYIAADRAWTADEKAKITTYLEGKGAGL
jgi:hypothetical protein